MSKIMRIVVVLALVVLNSTAVPAYAVPRGLYVSSEQTSQILRYDADTGAFIEVFASGGDLSFPNGLIFGSDGDLYVTSQQLWYIDHSVKRYDGETGTFIDTFASGGGLHSPIDLTFGPDGDLYVASSQTDNVLRYDGETGAFIDVFAEVPLEAPCKVSNSCRVGGLAFGPDGNLYVSSYGANSIFHYDGQTGDFIGALESSSEVDQPFGMVFGPDGNLYVACRLSDNVVRFDGETGAFIDVFAIGGGLDEPVDLEFGPDGNLYVSSYVTNSILRYDGQTGVFIDVFASFGGLFRPTFVTFFLAPVPPVANFRASPVRTITQQQVSFTDESTGTIDSWLWDFGDGNTSEDQNPTHAYDYPDIYSVSLTVSGPAGSDNKTKNDYITVVSSNAADLSGGCREFHSYKFGERIVVKLQVVNTGNEKTGSFKVAFYLSSSTFPLQETTVRNGLGLNQTKHITFKHKSETPLSGQNIRAEIDPDNVVLELDETNNSVIIGIP